MASTSASASATATDTASVNGSIRLTGGDGDDENFINELQDEVEQPEDETEEERKQREKEEQKALKDQEKAQQKALKDQEKAEKKAQKEQEQAEKKAQKEREKANKGNGSGSKTPAKSEKSKGKRPMTGQSVSPKKKRRDSTANVPSTILEEVAEGVNTASVLRCLERWDNSDDANIVEDTAEIIKRCHGTSRNLANEEYVLLMTTVYRLYQSKDSNGNVFYNGKCYAFKDYLANVLDNLGVKNSDTSSASYGNNLHIGVAYTAFIREENPMQMRDFPEATNAMELGRAHSRIGYSEATPINLRKMGRWNGEPLTLERIPQLWRQIVDDHGGAPTVKEMRKLIKQYVINPNGKEKKETEQKATVRELLAQAEKRAEKYKNVVLVIRDKHPDDITIDISSDEDDEEP